MLKQTEGETKLGMELQVGSILEGKVTTITKFGAFVALEGGKSGLVHISELADRFVQNPADVVSLHQHVQVRVIGVDRVRKRIQLSMKGLS